MEIDESDDILIEEQTRIYNETHSRYCEHDLDFMNYCDERIDSEYDEGTVNKEYENIKKKNGSAKDEVVADVFGISTRMTVDIKNIRGCFHLNLENLCKIMDIIVLYNMYDVVQKTTLKKTDCIGGYTIIYTCSEGVLYLNTYEFYDYATFYMDVRRVPDRHAEFFDIFDFITDVFNSDKKSENITITTATS